MAILQSAGRPQGAQMCSDKIGMRIKTKQQTLPCPRDNPAVSLALPAEPCAGLG